MATFDVLDQVEAGLGWPVRQKKKNVQKEKRINDCVNVPITSYTKYLKNIAYNLK